MSDKHSGFPKRAWVYHTITDTWVSAGKTPQKAENERLREENERLRKLLKKCQPYVEAGLSACDTQLCDAIEKEVGDE
ncbi:MAG: hypothetical protein ACO23H_19770, partial [Alphaproteobacteria bacterium]